MYNLPPSERISFALRSLYDQFGYSRYKMNKFEEYDLYARNKDFLISEGVITFTDTNGKLMALKPDVTLSIVKNTRDESGIIQKLYYNESVYRVSKGTHSFREIPQIGLEAIGKVDDYCIYEVLKLAAESLSCTGCNCILEVSHLGLLEDLLQHSGISAKDHGAVLRCISEKNPHELHAVCRSLDVSEENIALLKRITALYGTTEEVLPQVEAMLSGIANPGTLSQFKRILTALNCGKWSSLIRIDFSVVSDLRYYNGFVFKGFAEGIPSSILSGGQYDKLMQQMKRQSGAIGFAVYLDLLEQYTRAQYDVDTLLVYDDSVTLEQIEAQAKLLGKDGQSILVQRQIPQGLRCRNILKLTKGGVENA